MELAEIGTVPYLGVYGINDGDIYDGTDGYEEYI